MVDTNNSTIVAIKMETTADEQGNAMEFSKEMSEKGSNNVTKDDTCTDRDGLFRCLDCGEAFEEEAIYLEHSLQHNLDNSVVPQLDGLLSAKDDNRTTQTCTLCGLAFSNSNGLKDHLLHSHTNRGEHVSHPSLGLPKQHIYNCQDCGKSYSAIGHFLNHRRSHKQASKSVFHELEQLKKKSFQCETCGRSYSRASALDAHRRCHEGKLIVKSRNRSAVEGFSPDDLVVGAENNTSEQTENVPEKLFDCSCGKAFYTMSRLKTHQRFSHNIKCSPGQLQEKNKEKIKKQFSCNECEKTFSSHVALNSHQRWHVNRSDEAGKKFPCEECGKAFMTLTFYYKHQRLAHSEETPAKSFLHQVCQLQKKSFQCKDCGLRFSRASALQSHQLCHTDVFKSSQVVSQRQTSPLPQKNVVHSSKEETQCFVLDEMGYTPNIHHIPLIAEDSILNETDEDVEGYETGDFNVEVISASDSSVIDEDEPTQDLNPDLELLCESDQEGKDDFDLKIVQIDFEQLEQQVAREVFETNGDPTPIKRLNCPQCSSWFSTASSLRSHIMWHGTHQEKVNSDQHLTIYTCDICGFEASSQDTHSNHKQKHVNEEQSNIVLAHAAELERKRFKCDECGKEFSRMSALISHRQHHPKRKPYPCPDCETSYSHASGLYSHRKTCHALKKLQDGIFAPKKGVFNPKKTLLGPKVFHCELCGKGFWSLGAYSHHKQNQAQCTDVQLKNNQTASLQPVNGHTRTNAPVACPVCGRKFRHKGVMKSHMRKHENGNHKCDLCDRSFRLLSSLFRHQVVHSAEVLPPPIKSFQYQVEQVQKNTYSCPDCGKRFSRAKALQFHMKSHGYETGLSPSSPKSAVKLEELQCSTCLAHFNNRSSLRAHQKLCGKQKMASQRHDEVTQSVSLKDNTILECPKCLSLFNNVLSLQCHIKQCKQPVATVGGLHLNKDVKDCLMKVTRSDKQPVRPTEDPEKGNRSELDTQLHKDKLVSLNTADLKYKCKECERSFKVVGALNFHKRVHLLSHKSKKKTKIHVSPMLKRPKQKEHTRGPFFCSDCGRRFTSNAALGTHRRWHTDKKFAGSLIKNERTNSIKSVNEGPFHCNKCGKGFFYLCVLRRHQLYYPPCQTKAEQEPDIDTSAHSSKSHTEFSCPECIKTFVRGSLLAAHYESEHSKSLESAGSDHGHTQVLFPSDEVPTKEDFAPRKFKAVKKSKLRSSIFPCPHCNKAFSKIRGLRAHKWQAHSKSVMGQSTSPTNKVVGRDAQSSTAIIQGEIVTKSNNPSIKTKHSLAKKKSATKKEKKKVRFASPQLKPFPCLDCGKRYSSAGALYNHRKMCLGLKQEKKAAETVTKEPSPVSRLSEQNIKCLFKCDKCGKAFPTEEQLGAHKDLAKKLPFCCALCCRGYWTESQLQQHLVWHDEVRCRLPTELRYRLSASLTKPTKADIPLSDKKVNSFLESPTVSSATRSQNSHKCQHCGKAFLSPAALQKHEAQHNTLHSYRCSLCPRNFGEIRDLIDHHQECMGDDKGQSDAHAALSKGDPLSLTCIECGISFGQEMELHQHYIEHARVMRCHDCGEKFIRWDAFKTHLRMHVLEEDEERRLQSMKRQTESKGKSYYKEPKGQKKIKSRDETEEVQLKTEAWDGENSDVDVDGVADDHDDEVLESFRKSPSKLVRVHPGIMAPVKSKPFFTQSQKVYACGICGKVYSYMESFRNHQKKHEATNKGHQEHKCPNCGKSFARPALLMAHLKVHRPSAEQEINTLKCDQCNKHFNSLQTWMIHIDLHKQKPFWCLTCAKGFRDEVLLDKHLQGHNLRRHKCNICSKTFRVPAELRYHYNTHTGAKPYRCNLCKKNFSQLGNLITHRKKHVGVYVGTSKTPLGDKIKTYSRRRVTEMKRLIFERVGNREEIETREEEASLGEREIIGDHDAKEGSEVSGAKEYCFEEQCSKVSHSELSGSSEASSSGESESDSSDSVSEHQEKLVPKKVLPVSNPAERELSKHWEWECFECDLGFAKEAELHMHYMKHASGELPIL